MKYDELKYQSGVEALRDVPINIDELEKYIIWKPIQERIDKLRKRKE